MSPTVEAIAPSFTLLGVPEPISRSLAGRGITEPFPIQGATLPDSLAGRDVIGRGRTGSGKTVAFAIPTVVGVAQQRARRQPKSPQGLVLVPTRELAAQVADTLRPIAEAMNLRVAVIHGGVPINPQAKAMMSCDIVVACPGRLEDLISQRLCRLDNVAVTVLDEADHMADLGFLPAVKRLLDQTPRDGQRMLFSATLDNGVDVLVKRYLHQPVTHSVDPAESPVPDMKHHLLLVSAADKPAVVRRIASGHGRSLLFTRTKHGAKKLAQQLTKSGIHSVELHGNLSQNARERNLALFASGEARVLVATDIAARGIHVDAPEEHKAFLHRSGRTARAGASGTVITIATPEQRRDVNVLTRRAGIQPEVTNAGAEHPLLDELVGPAAPPSAPRPVVEHTQPPTGSRKQQHGRPARPGQPVSRPNGRPGARKPQRSGQRSR